MKKLIKITAFILAISALFLFTMSCESVDDVPSGKAYYDYSASNTGKGTEIKTMFVAREVDSMKVEDFEPSDLQSDFVLIKIKDYGSVVAVLRSDVAPLTVANFKKLVSEKFFDNTVFHRVVNSFMIQGGGMVVEKSGDGVLPGELKEKEADSIKGEFTQNGFENNLLHIRGVLSMARTNDPNSASSQFFIIHESGAHLNGQYAAFGYVLAGMDVVDAIASCKVTDDVNSPRPIVDVVIESVSFVQHK